MGGSDVEVGGADVEVGGVDVVKGAGGHSHSVFKVG